MLIIGINGSPNRKGNTAYLLNVALEAAKDKGAKIELIQVMDALKGQERPYCIACSSPCEGKCFKDTPLEQAYQRLAKADGLIIGSPVYFGTVSAQLKAFWDKTRKLRSDRGLVGTPGAAISTGASRYGGQETTVETIHNMMLIHGMSVVGDGTFDTDAGHLGAHAQKPASADEDAVKRTKILGQRLVEEAVLRSEARKKK